MPQFKFRLLDYHNKVITNDEGQIILKPMISDGFKVFHMVVDTDFLWIIGFRSDAIIDDEGNPIEFTKVFLSNGETVFAANTLKTFESNYNQNYSPIFNPPADPEPTE